MSLNTDFLPAMMANGDFLLTIERSFNIKLKRDALQNVATVSDLCDAVYDELKHSHAEGCSTQQAFYRFRNAVMAVSPCHKSEITPACKVKTIFPCENRAEIVEQVEAELGLKLDILQPKPWISATLGALFLASVSLCFIYGIVGLVGVALAVGGYKFSMRFCSELKVKTVGDLVAKLVRDNHLKSRRGSTVVNRKEVEQKLRELFAEQRQFEPVLA